MSGALAVLPADVVLQDPQLLVLALPVAAALLVARRRAPAVRFAAASLLPARTGSWRTRARGILRLVEAAALLLMVVALARPVVPVPAAAESPGVDVVLCLDVSSSMNARDLDPARSRLDVARAAAAEFVAARPRDRIGLVRFARYPDLACPPTLDHDALLRFLAATEPVEPEGPEDATGIGTAVARAAEVLRAAGSPSKVVILLTDGEENVATAAAPEEIAPWEAARLAEAFGVRVHAVAAGIGAPTAAGGFVPLDVRPLRRLAETTGGTFREARDAAALADVYAAIDALETAPLAKPGFRLEDRFLPVLAAALVLLGGAALLRRTLLAVVP